MQSIGFVFANLSLGALSLSIVFFIIWRYFGKSTPVLNWSVAYFCYFVAYGLGTLGIFGFIPGNWYQDIFEASVLSALMFVMRGILIRYNFNRFDGLIALVTVTVFLLHAWLYWSGVASGYTLMTLPIYGGVTEVIGFMVILRFGRPLTAPSKGALALLAFAAFISFLVSWFTFLFGKTGDSSYYQLYASTLFTLMWPVVFGIGIFLMLMVLEDQYRSLRDMADTDVLTKVSNRRGFYLQAKRLEAQVRRSGQCLAVAVCDIDRFKQINDKFGHDGGDRVIQHFATLLSNSVRQSDLVGRVGGEEFALMLPNATVADAQLLLERIRSELQGQVVGCAEHQISYTASFGIAVLMSSDADFKTTLKRADQALYRAKENGRDRIEVEHEQNAPCWGERLQPSKSH